ncbi:MAG: GtrA family protein [Burkholderiaceae bacterium]
MSQGLWFITVGAGAALTHLAVFALLHHGVAPALWPEVANAIGFVVAFGVSFSGHRTLSFQDAGTTVRQSLWRFAATALAGLVTNEIIFALLLRGVGLWSMLALLVALVAAAGQTFVLSRFWAFRR